MYRTTKLVNVPYYIGDTPSTSSHSHTFSLDWSKNETAHWHACTATGCTINDYSTCGEAGAAYGTHVGMEDFICDTCLYENKGGAKTAASSAIDTAVNGDTSANVVAAAAAAKQAIEAAGTVEAIEAAKADGLAKIALAKALNAAFDEIDALAGSEPSNAVSAIVTAAKAAASALSSAQTVDAVNAEKEKVLADILAQQLIEAKEAANTGIRAAVESRFGTEVWNLAQKALAQIDEATTLDEVAEIKAATLTEIAKYVYTSTPNGLSGQGGAYQLSLGGTPVGNFLFEKVGSGWYIKTTDGKYVTCNQGKMSFADEPFVWNYDGGVFYTRQDNPNSWGMKGVLNAIGFLFGVGQKINYYLVCDGNHLAVSRLLEGSSASFSQSNKATFNPTVKVTSLTRLGLNYTYTVNPGAFGDIKVAKVEWSELGLIWIPMFNNDLVLPGKNASFKLRLTDTDGQVYTYSVKGSTVTPAN